LRELAEQARTARDNLENLVRERESELEGQKKEIESLKTEKEHLNCKVSEVFHFERLEIY
jgi:phage shock protein A